MKYPRLQVGQIILIIGDLLVIILVTLSGFATHRELGSAQLQRILAVFLPTVVAWLAVLPFSLVYDLKYATQVRQLWRPFWAMFISMPFAMWLRSAWLGTTVIPMFVLVMAGISAGAIFIWRAVFIWLGRTVRLSWMKYS